MTPEQQREAKDIEDISINPEVKQAMRSVTGEAAAGGNPRLQAAARAVGSIVMETGTAVRNIAAIPTTIAAYPGVNFRSVTRAILGIKQRAVRAYENNAIRTSFKDYDAAGEFNGSSDRFIAIADKFVTFMRKWTGRDLSDKTEGLFHFSLGEELAKDWFAQAKDGNIDARRMLNRFGTTQERNPRNYFDPAAPVTEDDVARVAKEFVNAARGTYC